MATGGNRVMRIIEHYLLTPAYVGMIAGLLIRSVALVLSVATPYAAWPLVLRIVIELFAAIGMVGCADIVLSAASAARAALNRQIAAVLASEDYQPNPRLSPTRYQQQKVALDAKRESVLMGLRDEAKREQFAILGSGAITVSYGVLFGLTVLADANLITILIEVIGVAAIPFVTWYIAAQYKEQQAAPDERAKTIALEAVDSRLVAARNRLSTGDETDADLNLMDKATKGSPTHNELVRALKTPPSPDAYMTTPEIYTALGAETSSAQSTIRRIVRRAGEKGQHGVVRHPETDAWVTPRSAFFDLFGHLVGKTAIVVKTRTTASNPRTNGATSERPSGETPVQGPSNVRELPGDSETPERMMATA